MAFNESFRKLRFCSHHESRKPYVVGSEVCFNTTWSEGLTTHLIVLHAAHKSRDGHRGLHLHARQVARCLPVFLLVGLRGSQGWVS